jgi:hypothetical protein
MATLPLKAQVLQPCSAWAFKKHAAEVHHTAYDVDVAVAVLLQAIAPHTSVAEPLPGTCERWRSGLSCG